MHRPQAYAQLAKHIAGIDTSPTYRHHYRRQRYSTHQADFDTMLTKARTNRLPVQAEPCEQHQRTKPQVSTFSQAISSSRRRRSHDEMRHQISQQIVAEGASFGMATMTYDTLH